MNNENYCNLEQKLDKLIDYLSYSRVPGFSSISKPQQYISDAIECAELHKRAFADKRFMNYGKDVVICGTGPSFDYFIPIKNAYYIGVNHAYNAKNIKFDALFCQDVKNVFNGMLPKDFIEYRGKDCIKFIGNNQPLTVSTNMANYNVFYYKSENQYNFQIDLRQLPDFCSVIFSAMAYALWTAPKRIFVVGADCSKNHAQNLSATHTSNLEYLVEEWHRMKKYYFDRFYPDVEIISVNPVGLKSLFNKNVYTKTFLDFQLMQDVLLLDDNGNIEKYKY